MAKATPETMSWLNATSPMNQQESRKTRVCFGVMAMSFGKEFELGREESQGGCEMLLRREINSPKDASSFSVRSSTCGNLRLSNRGEFVG